MGSDKGGYKIVAVLEALRGAEYLTSSDHCINMNRIAECKNPAVKQWYDRYQRNLVFEGMLHSDNCMSFWDVLLPLEPMLSTRDGVNRTHARLKRCCGRP